MAPPPVSLARQHGHAHQPKADFTVETAGRVEPIGSVGMDTELRTLSAFCQNFTGHSCTNTKKNDGKREDVVLEFVKY